MLGVNNETGVCNCQYSIPSTCSFQRLTNRSAFFLEYVWISICPLVMCWKRVQGVLSMVSCICSHYSWHFLSLTCVYIDITMWLYHFIPFNQMHYPDTLDKWPSVVVQDSNNHLSPYPTTSVQLIFSPNKSPTSRPYSVLNCIIQYSISYIP